jgi:hypothetical protein
MIPWTSTRPRERSSGQGDPSEVVGVGMATALRANLVRLGRHLGEGQLARLRSALGYLEIGALAHRLAPDAAPVTAADRFGVFEHALTHVHGDAPLYLEFGVYRGETMRWWADHLRAPAARLVGFDSFEGLPTAWRPGFESGRFGTAGPPDLADPRVGFMVGWFDETVPGFEPPPHDQLIVNVDCDLYSSARTVLAWAAPHLKAGSLLYFDELADRDHELRALHELLDGSGITLRPLAMGGGGNHFLFAVA